MFTTLKQRSLAIRVLSFLSMILIVKVTAQIVANYSDYFPPNFQSGFLLGRQGYFHSIYRLSFYAHILASPVALLSGLVLIQDPFRRRFPAMHRAIGKFQIGVVILLVAPSGIWMSSFAQTGIVAGFGFASLAIATGVCALFGWRRAMQKRFTLHRRWMLRTFLLLCSAIFLRLIAGAATVLNWDAPWLYPLSAWMAWIVPMFVFELWEQRKNVEHALSLVRKACM